MSSYYDLLNYICEGGEDRRQTKNSRGVMDQGREAVGEDGSLANQSPKIDSPGKKGRPRTPKAVKPNTVKALIKMFKDRELDPQNSLPIPRRQATVTVTSSLRAPIPATTKKSTPKVMGTRPKEGREGTWMMRGTERKA